ncbi:MAG: ABC transporter ATP-binding protein, partial [Prosthecobacter sp.]|nr:ABC transporter ATP-binding protein [Prosthecobacter sp.]
MTSVANHLQSSGWLQVAVAAACWFVARGASEAVNGLWRVQNALIANTMSDNISAEIQGRVSSAPFEIFDDPIHHDVVFRARQDGASRPQGVAAGTIAMIESSVSLISLLILLWTFNPLPALIVITANAPHAIAVLRSARRRYVVEQKLTVRKRRSVYFNMILTDRRYGADVRLFQLAEYFMKKFRRERRGALRATQKLQRNIEGLLVLTKVTALGGAAICIFIIARAVTQDLLTVGAMVMLVQCVSGATDSMNAVVVAIGTIYDNSLFLTNYGALKALPTESRIAAAQPITWQIDEIELSDVGFRYGADGPLVLSGVGLVMKRGTFYAVVGESGSGKSTLLSIVGGLYDACTGGVPIFVEI